jgi:DNA recombination protein RmuC
MGNLNWLLLFASGILIGGVLVFLFRKNSENQAYDRGKSEFLAKNAVLEERIANFTEKISVKDGKITSLETELSENRKLIEHLNSELKTEAEKRSASEERNSFVDKLENDLQSKQEIIGKLQEENSQLRETAGRLQTRLDDEIRAGNEKIAVLRETLELAEKRMTDAFQTLAADNLEKTGKTFWEFAQAKIEKYHEIARGDLELRTKSVEEMVKPIRESMDRVGEKISEIEKERAGAFGTITAEINNLREISRGLGDETRNLVKALRSPNVRGRWGEIQLQRVVEFAGMLEYCDFFRQQTLGSGDNRQRPDMIVKLPNNREVIVDSKVPLQAYLEALESQDEDVKNNNLRKHAEQVRKHVVQLSSKTYWEQLGSTPEFVVLFLPGEVFFTAALEQDPALIEDSIRQNVIIATPTTLIALLRAVAYGWKQEKIADNARVISELGKELYRRIGKFADHFSRLGRSLESTVNSYNDAVGSLESRVMVSARKFSEIGAVGDGDIEMLPPVDVKTRRVNLQALPGVEASDETISH